MLAWPVYLLRMLLWWLSWPLRALSRPPKWLHVSLEGAWTALEAPPAGRLRRLLSRTRPSVQRLAEVLEAAAAQRRVRGVVVEVHRPQIGLVEVAWLRGKLAALRAAGKRVVVWAPSYDTRGLLLASAADRVLLQPGGAVGPLGIHRRLIYLRDALAKVGVSLDVLRTGPHKAALDRFTEEGLTPELREMLGWLLDDVHAGVAAELAAGRGVDEATVRGWIDGGPWTDEDAIAAGIVDALASAEDLPAELAAGAPADKHPPRPVDWARAAALLTRRCPRRPGKVVALLRIEGTIAEGRSHGTPGGLPAPAVVSRRAGDLTVVQQVRAATRDSRVAAAVLYVDSPGGSAAASEAMASALSRLAASKPLVCVMGSVAGSGGYYVATPAGHVIAAPATLTGSIGVVMAKLVAGGLLDQLLLKREALTIGRRAGIYDPERPFDAEEREAMTRLLERTYDVFAARVAEGRGLSREAVDAVGRGRVWTGRQALERGLIDALGGIEDGLNRARELAGLSARAPLVPVRVGRRWGPPPPPPAPTEALAAALDTARQLTSGAPLYLAPWLGDAP